MFELSFAFEVVSIAEPAAPSERDDKLQTILFHLAFRVADPCYKCLLTNVQVRRSKYQIVSRENRSRYLPDFFADLDVGRMLLIKAKRFAVESISCFKLRPNCVLLLLGLAMPRGDGRVVRNLLSDESKFVGLELVSLP